MRGREDQLPYAAYNLIVLTNPVDGREDEYNDWYTNVHLDDVLESPRRRPAQRFRLTEHQRDQGPYPWKYLAVYECETDDVRNVISGLEGALPNTRDADSATP